MYQARKLYSCYVHRVYPQRIDMYQICQILCSILVDTILFVHVGSCCFMAYTPQVVHVATVTLALFTKTVFSAKLYMCTSDTVDCVHNKHYSLRTETVWVVYNILYNNDTIQLPGAHEWKERSTTRNGVWTMKPLTRELVLPYKEPQFHLLLILLHCTIIIHLPLCSCYSTFHIR